MLVNDIVLAFDSLDSDLSKPLEAKKVSRVFNNISPQIIDLRGLHCTPGHVFLNKKDQIDKKYSFATIANILRDDLPVVTRDNKLERARTGSIVGSLDDVVVNVVLSIKYIEDACISNNIVIRVRSGVLVHVKTGNHSMPLVVVKLSKLLLDRGITVMLDGRLQDGDGDIYDFCDWPEGSTPFDTSEMRNWIVEVDGQLYTPPWILALPDTDDAEGIRIVGQDRTLTSALEAIQQHVPNPA